MICEAVEAEIGTAGAQSEAVFPTELAILEIGRYGLAVCIRRTL